MHECTRVIVNYPNYGYYALLPLNNPKNILTVFYESHAVSCEVATESSNVKCSLIIYWTLLETAKFWILNTAKMFIISHLLYIKNFLSFLEI